MSRQNQLCHDTDSCNMEELVETKESTERRNSVATRKFMSQQMTLACCIGSGRNKGTQRWNILQAEEISLCRDMDFNVATQKLA